MNPQLWPQSAIGAAGGPASSIETLWWVFFWLLLAIFVIVMAFVGGSLTRRHRGIKQEPLESTHTPSPATEKRLTSIVASASAVTLLILLVLIVVSVSVGKATVGPGNKSDMTIEITGNQWWWQVRYLNDDPSRVFVTANELHIPVGRPVMIREQSNDVIHSFWVPNLQGKRDLIPSRVNTEWIRADRPGRFRGQCAEFCGLQHAHMALWVVAEPQQQFDQWIQSQLQPSAPPANSTQVRGQQVFMDHACILCHTITGTPAGGQVGPDLTHLGGRLSLAAGTLPNNAGNLAGWITDPQNIKPGNHMATVPLEPDDLQALIEYLENLK